MSIKHKHWYLLFPFSLGLAFGSGFCMKWLEADFLVNGERFDMFGLELFYNKEKVEFILSNLDVQAETALRRHLYFDFVFMAGIFSAISCLCMIAKEKVSAGRVQKMLFIAAAMQLLAWAGDATEDLYLLKWLDTTVTGNEFSTYHFIVAAKWVIGIAGFLFAAAVLLLRSLRKKK